MFRYSAALNWTVKNTFSIWYKKKKTNITKKKKKKLKWQ